MSKAHAVAYFAPNHTRSRYGDRPVARGSGQLSAWLFGSFWRRAPRGSSRAPVQPDVRLPIPKLVFQLEAEGAFRARVGWLARWQFLFRW